MVNLLDIFGNRELDDWRDTQILTAAKVLNQLAANLIDGFEAELKDATWKDGLIAPDGFINTRVSPRLTVVSEAVVAEIVTAANAELARIVAHQAIWARRPVSEIAGDDAFEGTGDVILAAGPIAAGVAVAAALPTAALVTTGGLFGTGLFAATAVSWPVVAVGGTAIGIALAVGALNTSRIWNKAERRLRARTARHITGALIRGTETAPSILEQLTTLFREAAQTARKRR